jgi:hypothetical protein
MIPIRKGSMGFNDFFHMWALPFLLIGLFSVLVIGFLWMFPFLIIIPLVLGGSYLAYKIDYPRLVGTARDKEKVLSGRLHKIPEFFNYLIGGAKMSYNTVELHQKLEAITRYLKIKFNKIPEHYECIKEENDEVEIKPVPGTIMEDD